jgi:proline iminopeptidase
MKYRITEGYMPFIGHRTYYRIVGEASDKAPLLLLHGGPGSTHNYFEVLDCMADTGRQVISYDQIGCGNSYLDGHPELWTQQTWIDELIAIREYLHLDTVHILGQSWGAMQAIAYAIDQKPTGIKSLILSSGHASSSLWASEQHRLIHYMSREDQAAIRRAEATGNWQDPAYLRANDHYYQLYVTSVDENTPECVRRPKRSGTEAYLYGWGPNEYQPLGSLKNFEYTGKLHEITQPTLICSGTRDICTPVVAASLYENIPGSRWHLFRGARHMCFVDAHQEYCQVLSSWLQEMDNL